MEWRVLDALLIKKKFLAFGPKRNKRART